MILHQTIKAEHLEMASLGNLIQDELRVICRQCKIDNVASLSKVHDAAIVLSPFFSYFVYSLS